ncbi:MAG: peptide chain release factor N(5)-glutamine methyltransferase [Alphaproteobacteria bacterium]|nr:peptide chain release factor N(5)-glutamine methyltransferase [Alphaproteobacteria bacterium]
MLVSLATLLNEYTKRLEAAEVFAPADDAGAILGHVLGFRPETIDQHLEVEVSEPSRNKAERAVQRREKREPLIRIFGSTQFCGLEIRTAEGVFRPIPESVDLVEHTLALLEDSIDEPFRLLDLGTGTGCILLALLHELPNATGLGIDIDERILKVARKNAEANGILPRAEFRQGNWDEAIEETFDLIVCNPPAAITNEIPLLDPEMRDYEPLAALDGGKDGLNAYRHLVRAFERLSEPDGIGVFQVNYKFREAALFQKAGFMTALKLNYRGNPNCLVVTNKERPPSIFDRLRRFWTG